MSPSTSVRANRFAFGLNDSSLALFGVAVILFAAVLWTAYGPNLEKTDFTLTYVGAKIVHDGLGSRLYDIALQKQVREAVFQHPNPLFFEHPPFEALLLSPLGGVPFRTAYTIWGFLNAAIWLATMVLLRPRLQWPREDLAYLSLWLFFAPLGVALYQGQSSLLLMAVYALTFVQIASGKEFLAGLVLGLGLIKLQFVLPFALIFLLRRHWRFVFGFGASSLLVGLLSLVAVGWRGFVDYVRFLQTIGSNPQNLSYGSAVDMPTIHGFLYAVLRRSLGGAELNFLVALCSISLLAWVAWRWQSGRESSLGLMFSAALAASLACGSHMFTHDFSPLVVPLFLVAAHFKQISFVRGSFRAVHWIAPATLVLFWTFPIYFLFVRWHCLFLVCPVLLLFTWSALQLASVANQQRETEAHLVVVG
jgi:glycosyl transferase family 87